MEYNLLTQQLLKEGLFTKEHFPAFVKYPNNNRELFDIEGGFVYKQSFFNGTVYETPCGLQIKGEELYYEHMNLSFQNETFSLENDNAIVTCPFRKCDCCQRNSLLKELAENGSLNCCAVKRVSSIFQLEKSIEMVEKKKQEVKNRKYEEFVQRTKNHVCLHQMHYDEDAGEWILNYNPMTCINQCGKGGTCNLRKTELPSLKGNVFFDIKATYPYKPQGNLLDLLSDQKDAVVITRGIRVFDTNKNLYLCKEVVKRCKDDIVQKQLLERHYESYMFGTRFEIMNIRAEKREGRDLLQDLDDIKAGITIYHDSDQREKSLKLKKEKLQQLQNKKVRMLEKKILKFGYDSFEDYSLEKRHADAWLSLERLKELEEIRKDAQDHQMEQIDLFSLFES